MARSRDKAGTVEDLFAAVAEHPDDIAAYQVLADALEQSGDPRAELIQIQLRLPTAKGGERDKLVARERKLIAARRKAMLPGKLAKSRAIELGYKHGFLDTVTVSAPLEPTVMADALAAIFASPDSALLATVAIVPPEDGAITEIDDVDDDENEGDEDEDGDDEEEEGEEKEEDGGAAEQAVDEKDEEDEEDEEEVDDGYPIEEPIKTVLEALASSKVQVPRTVKQLVLGRAFQKDRSYRCFGEPGQMSFRDDLSELLAVFPHVEAVRVDLGCVDLEWKPLVSDRLRRFEYVSPFIQSSELEAFASSKLPALEAMSLWTGSYGTAYSTSEIIENGLDGAEEQETLAADDFAPLLAQLARYEHFKELGFPNFGADLPALCEAIAKVAALASKLEVLDFSRCDLDSADAKAIKKLTAKTPALREIRVEGAFATKAVLAQLKIPKVAVVGKPGKGNKRYRYITTYE